MDRSELSNLILDIIEKEENRPLPVGILFKKIGHSVNTQKNRGLIFDTINKLTESGSIRKLKSGTLLMGYPKAVYNEKESFTGTIYISTKKTGFINLPGEDKSSFFVHKSNLNGALDGDEVCFAILDIDLKEGQDLKHAIVLNVIGNKKNEFVGHFIDDDTGYRVICEDSKVYLPIKLLSLDGLKNGTKFLFLIVERECEFIVGKVQKIIGHAADVGVDILSVIYDNGVNPVFDQDIINQTNKITVDSGDSYQKQIRKDLTSLPIITIDPASSKDFDDAIYVEKNGESFHLVVCIADVSHYVGFNTKLDIESLRRGTSIYLVDRVIPMLPYKLSDDICSLNPNVDRMSVTVQMDIDKFGNISNIATYPSIMKNHRRFTYDEVNDYFSKKTNLSNDTQEIKDVLDVGFELHNILTKAKNKRGYIEFDIPEPKIIVDKECFPIKIELKPNGEAQKMIEDFMVAANEAITIFAIKNKLPFVYRIHTKPEEKKLQVFLKEAKKLGFKMTQNFEDIQPNTISKWLNDNSSNENIDLINLMLLRTMGKAKYSIDNIGHFGLASSHYTHFTSPIRRYPDLIVHRILWMYIYEKDKYTDAQRNMLEAKLSEYCQQSNSSELIAVKCERDVNDMKVAEYMQKHIGDEFEVTAISILPFGIFVQMSNTVEGLIRLANMKDDIYNFNENDFTIVGRRTGNTFSLGTKLVVRAISASKQLRKVEFELVKIIKNRR